MDLTLSKNLAGDFRNAQITEQQGNDSPKSVLFITSSATSPPCPIRAAASKSRPPSLLSAHGPPPRCRLCLLPGAAPVGCSRGGDTGRAATSGESAGAQDVARGWANRANAPTPSHVDLDNVFAFVTSGRLSDLFSYVASITVQPVARLALLDPTLRSTNRSQGAGNLTFFPIQPNGTDPRLKVK